MSARKLITAATCLCALALAACGGGASSSASDGVLTVALPEHPASLDPATSIASVERHVLYQLYDRLVEIDDDLRPRPGGLTEQFEVSQDGQTYTFDLRRNVEFHNGEQFDASAVKAHFDRLYDPEVGSPYLEDFEALHFESVDVVDDYTVRFQLSRPSPFFLAALADPAGASIPAPDAVEEAGRDFGTQPVGTGPYRLESWTRGDAITLVRNDSYWDEDLPRSNQLVFRGYADSNSAQTQFLSGQVDIIARLSPQGVSQIEDGGDQVINEPGIETVRVFFNSTRPPFDDERVRQAVAAALDRDSIRETVAGEAAITGGQALAPIGVYERATRPAPERDVDRAERLLADAGLADGFEVTLLTYADNQDYARAAQLIASQLQEIGIDVLIEPVQLNALLERISPAGGRDYEVTMLGGGAGNPDPVPWLYTNFGENGSSQFGAAGTPAMEDGFRTAMSTQDVDERINALQVVNREIEDTAAQVTLWFYNSLMATRSGVEGVDLTPTGVLNLWEASE